MLSQKALKVYVGFAIAIISDLLVPSVSQLFDQTLVPYSEGKDVVSAVLKKIHRSKIFEEDYDFLQRVAYYETRFGTLNLTYSDDYFGGIWQVEERDFDISQGRPPPLLNLTEYYDAVNTTFGIYWPHLSWNDLVQPLNSALALRIWLLTLPEGIPNTIEAQAIFWSKYHNKNDSLVEDFTLVIKDYENFTATCRGLMDLSIVLDGSLSEEDFQISQEFILNFIGSFSDTIRVGLIVYSDEAEVIFPVDNDLTYDELQSLVLNTTYSQLPNTSTNAAMLTAVELMNNSTDSSCFEDCILNGIPRIMTVLTSHTSTDFVLSGPYLASVMGIATFGVGIGDNTDGDEILMIAQKLPSRTLKVHSYDVLNEFYSKLSILTCEIAQRPAVETLIEDSLLEKERRYYTYDLPNDGLTLIIQAYEGDLIGYYSYTDETPSSALYHRTFEGSDTTVRITNDPSEIEGIFKAFSRVYISIEGKLSRNVYTIQAFAGATESTTEDGSTASESTTGEYGGEETTEYTVETPQYSGETVETTAYSEGTDETTEYFEGTDETTAYSEGTDETTEYFEGTDETTANSEVTDETTENFEGTDETTAYSEATDETTEYFEGTDETTAYSEVTDETTEYFEGTDETTAYSEVTDETTEYFEGTDETTAYLEVTDETTEYFEGTDETTAYSEVTTGPTTTPTTGSTTIATTGPTTTPTTGSTTIATTGPTTTPTTGPTTTPTTGPTTTATTGPTTTPTTGPTTTPTTGPTTTPTTGPTTTPTTGPTTTPTTGPTTTPTTGPTMFPSTTPPTTTPTVPTTIVTSTTSTPIITGPTSSTSQGPIRITTTFSPNTSPPSTTMVPDPPEVTENCGHFISSSTILVFIIAGHFFLI